VLITTGGQMVRIRVADAREAGRNTQGVKLVPLDDNDRLQAIAPVSSAGPEAAAGASAQSAYQRRPEGPGGVSRRP
jgi:DNA gyrase subunit A